MGEPPNISTVKLNYCSVYKCTDNLMSENHSKCISFTIDSDTQGSDKRLGGGGIAAVAIVSLVMVIVVVVLVVFIAGSCYLTKYKTGIKRSGKYVVNNSDIEGV